MTTLPVQPHDPLRRRDVLFVFGAGASYAEGAPLKRELLPFILGGSNSIAESKTGQRVRGFIERYFGWNPATDEYPTLESVFAFLDYFLLRNEALNGECSTDDIREIKESLIKLIYYSVGRVSGKRSGVYRRFWEAVKQHNRNIAVITTNYDTFLERAFEFLYPTHGAIDYGLRLMNYDYHGDAEPLDWWANPREPSDDGIQRGPAIPILKLHGSLNWKYCNCCNQVLLTPWSTEINLETGRFVRRKPNSTPDNPELMRCPLDGTPFQTLIIPPTHLTTIDHPIINLLLAEAAREVRIARRIVFVGYSFPMADVHLKALFMKNLRLDTELVVINPSEANKTRLAYRAFANRARFVQARFENVVADLGAIRNLLTMKE